MIFDSQFIIIQRYNRPRIVKLLERQEKHTKKDKEKEDVTKERVEEKQENKKEE